MKKVFVLLFVLLLSACQSQTIDINEKISKTLSQAQNFTVTETFDFKQYGKRDGEADSLIITTENELVYQQGTVYTDSHTISERNVLSTEKREIYRFESYIDIYNNTAYIKPAELWYQIDLFNLFLLNLASIDPVTVVNSLLYDNTNMYYKSDDGVTVDPEEYRYVVVDIPNDVFEDLFASTIFYHIDVQYDYFVSAELKFNEEFQVESITFQLDNLLSQYRDYHVYELKSEITSLSSSYKLEFSDYDTSSRPPIIEPINWVFSDETRELIGYGDVFNSNETFQLYSTLSYSQEDRQHQVTTTIDPDEAFRYLYYELYFLLEDTVINTYQSEYFDVLSHDELLLHYAHNVLPYDEVIMVMRYIPEGSSDIVDASLRVSVEQDETFDNRTLHIEEFQDDPTVLYPHVIVEDNGLSFGINTYDLTFILYATELVQNVDYELYLFADGILQDVIEIDDSMLLEGDLEEYHQEFSYVPDQIFWNVNYNITKSTRIQEQIEIDIQKIDDAFNETGYTVNGAISYDEKLNPDWGDYQYGFEANNQQAGVVYFVDELGSIMGVEFIQTMPNTIVWSRLYPKVSTIYFEEISEKGVLKHIIDEAS